MKLTEVELELMNIIWKIGKGTVRDVIAELSKSRKLAYTSVSTMLRILEKKQFLASQKESKSHIYSPVLERKAYMESSVSDLVDTVFDKAPTQLVKTLIKSQYLSQEDISELKDLINRLGKK